MSRPRKELSLIEFQIPQTKEIEDLLLAELISYPQTILGVRKVLTEDMFSGDEAKAVWNVLLRKFDKQEQIDLTTIYPEVDMEYMRGGILYNMRMMGSDMSVMSHAYSLREMAIRRAAYFNAIQVLQMVNDKKNADEILSQYDSFKKKVEGDLMDDDTKCIDDILNDVAEEAQQEGSSKIPTGFQTLDYYTYGGFNGGNLVILAARPSVGKTTIGLQMALQQSRLGFPSVYFSMEMKHKELGRKLLVSTGRVRPIQFYTKQIDWPQMEAAIGEISNNNLYINTKCRSVEELKTQITLMVRAGKCKIAYVDYLGLMKLPNKKLSKADLLAEVTADLKQLAMMLDIPIVLLCQMNRDSAKEGRPPQLFDLRDSGSIEQDGDRILMMERPRDAEEGENLIDMWIRKNREGMAGDIRIRLKGDTNYANFYEYD